MAGPDVEAVKVRPQIRSIPAVTVALKVKICRYYIHIGNHWVGIYDCTYGWNWIINDFNHILELAIVEDVVPPGI